MGDDGFVREVAQIGKDMAVQHGEHLEGRAGQHQNMDAVRFKGAAGSGAHRIVEHGAAHRQFCLLAVVLRHFDVGVVFEIIADGLQNILVENQRLAEGLADGLLGHVIVSGTQTAGGDDDIGPLAGDLQCILQTLGVVTHHGVPEYVHTHSGQGLREIPRIGVDDVAQQQFGADGDDFSGM